ncbi:uncharacterized protein LOC143879273 [Tasmannia lanceolata]|uniref:uncharacterized protein LOC143879273 n=1 Tax=Tasmannia lanceolata TaxID=3420 RepID=UPI004063B1AC
MAGVTEALFFQEEEIETLDPVPYWYTDFECEIYGSDSDTLYPESDSLHEQIGDHFELDEEFDVEIEEEGENSHSSSYFDGEDQVTLGLNLFGVESHDSVTNSFLETLDDLNFRAFEDNDGMDSNSLELGLGLGLGFDGQNHVSHDDMDSNSLDLGLGLGLDGRNSVSEDDEGIHIMGIDSDVEGEGDVSYMTGDDPSFPLCRDFLHLEDHRDSNEEFEWEQVDERVDERPDLNMVIDVDEDISAHSEMESELERGNFGLEAMRNHEWQVLLEVNELGRDHSIEYAIESYLEDPDDYIYTTEYEVLFDQFAENDNSPRGSPPAAKSVVDNLPSVVLTQNDVENDNALCAVCKDEFCVGEQAIRFPCFHHYHRDCILPWLAIRNTCPVCRYELPTDDPDYEHQRTQRVSRGLTGNSQIGDSHGMFLEQ